MCVTPVEQAEDMDVTPEVDALMRRQHSLISTPQLGSLGITPDHIRHLVDGRRLVRVRFRVYRAFGAPETWAMEAMSAVLAAGEAAVLSHRSAARLWGLAEPIFRPIELTAPRLVRLRGVVAHRHTLAQTETAVREQVPVTTIERTLVDIGEYASAGELGKLIDAAWRRGLTTPKKVGAVLSAHEGPGRRRRRTIREALAERGVGYDPGANDWEQEMDRRWEKLGLPASIRQYKVRLKGGKSYILDRAIVELKIGIEWNGRGTHGTRSGFAYDSNRRNDLTRAGWLILDFTPYSTTRTIVSTVMAACDQRRSRTA
jgi:very-short-patch-repair endonuclease